MNKQIKSTPAQESKCFILCQNLTDKYLVIHVIRLDERTGEIYILAGQETEILIFRNGEWRYES
jgi:hypothetical protein